MVDLTIVVGRTTVLDAIELTNKLEIVIMIIVILILPLNSKIVTA